ncbi:MAG: GSCFA domain-containing protein [Albidovulum sp.]
MSDTTQNKSPYEGLEARAFWRSGVAEAQAYPPPDVYQPRFPITRQMPVVTAGSCFAQHVGRSLVASGYNVIDTEPAPRNCPETLAHKYGYRLYSARYGNIYSVRQFLQLVLEASQAFTPAEPVWERGGRYFDALRPGVEPNGLDAPEHVLEAREYHLRAVRRALEQAQLVVFTMGLTECWEHIASGTVYPTAPGTIAGRMNPDVFAFKNFRFSEIKADFERLRQILQEISPGVKFLLTVSPVPLTATASGNHILPATIYSKSILRAVCGELCLDHDDIDYFPSYEIVASHPSRGSFFEENLRSVKHKGVKRVMRSFLAAHAGGAAENEPMQPKPARQKVSSATEDDLVCEEQLLEAFRK